MNDDPSAYYASRLAREQYLFFHYGTPRDYLPWPGPAEALDYPARALAILLDPHRLPIGARALDLGCAVGRTSFELSRSCDAVVGVDLSASFIRAANQMKRRGSLPLRYTIEGTRRGRTLLQRPSGSRPGRIIFRVGDAMHLDPRLGSFDVAVLLNLIDRLPDPAACLRALADRLNPGAQLLIASPYTWMEAYTPANKWLGGRPRHGTTDALQACLEPQFRMVRKKQIPFLIREHARKYQWSMAEGTAWIKR